MPNWCNTTYHIRGNQQQLSEIHSAVQTLEKMVEPYVPNGFGNLFLGCLINYFGGDYRKVYCRGYIYGYDLDEDTISLFMDTAWAETPEFRHFLLDRFPGIEIDFLAEEPGMGYYATNMDDIGEYHIDSADEDVDNGEDYGDLDFIINCVFDLTGKRAKTIDEVIAICDKYNNDHYDDDAYISIDKVEFITD